MDMYVAMARAYVETIMNRGIATYRKGVLDFTRGEGGNNHIYMLDHDGYELGHIWFDTHCGAGWPTEPEDTLGFCGKSNGSCSGVFRDILCVMYEHRWYYGGSPFMFTSKMFVDFMDRAIELVQ